MLKATVLICRRGANDWSVWLEYTMSNGQMMGPSRLLETASAEEALGALKGCQITMPGYEVGLEVSWLPRYGT